MLAWTIAVTVGLGAITWVAPDDAVAAPNTEADAGADRNASSAPPTASLSSDTLAYDSTLFINPGSDLTVTGSTTQDLSVSTTEGSGQSPTSTIQPSTGSGSSLQSTNVAGEASVSASTQNWSTQQSADKAVDGVADGYPGDATKEWSTTTEGTGAWLQLDWTQPVTLDRVTLFDRPNADDNITAARLVFADGSTVAVGALQTTGAATTVTFSARATTSLRLEITGVGPATRNVGLAELQAWTPQDTTSPTPDPTAEPPAEPTATPSPAQPSQNVAGEASVSASTQNWSTQQSADKAVDGVADGYPGDATKEWSTTTEGTGAWLQLDWTQPVTLDRVTLFDRPNADDNITAARLVFADGSTVAVGALQTTGAATTVTFSARATTSLRLEITGVGPATRNVGLAELQAWSTTSAPVSMNVAGSAATSASSEDYSTGQVGQKAIDGVADGYPGDYTAEWATDGGGAGSWLQLDWDNPVTTDRVVLFDRPNSSDNITAARLVFADGSTEAVTALDNAGAGTTITFPARSTSSLRLEVTEVSSTTGNIGLAEMQVWTPGQTSTVQPAPTSGPTASPTASSPASPTTPPTTSPAAGPSASPTTSPTVEPTPETSGRPIAVDSFDFEVRTGNDEESSTVVLTQKIPATYYEESGSSYIIDYAEWTIPAATFQDAAAFAVRVRAVNAAGTGNWSEFARVNINTPPAVPTLSSPTDGARVSGTRLDVSAILPGSFCGTGQAALLDHYGNVVDSRDTLYGCGANRVVTTALNFPSWAEAGDYTWQMRSNNSTAQSEWASQALHYTTPPSLFYGVSYEIVDRHVHLTWKTPYFTGGLTVDRYDIIVDDAATPISVAGNLLRTDLGELSLNQAHRIQIRGSNAAGDGPYYPVSIYPTVPAPGTPGDLTLTWNGQTPTLTWDAPSSASGFPATSYLVETTNYQPWEQTTVSVVDTRVQLPDVPYGQDRQYRVFAVNEGGRSQPVGTGGRPVRAPDAPTDVRTTLADSGMEVFWTPPAFDGGSAVHSYLVTASPGGEQVTVSGTTHAVIRGLTNGTAYTFTVAAINDVGMGPDSTPSAARTPTSESVDSDDDGLPDVLEDKAGSDPLLVDSDGDGLSDAEEVLSLAAYTNPTVVDTDNDGISDADDDADSDGLSNRAELNLGTNPANPDTDGDTLTDAVETTQNSPSDALLADTDADGIDDSAELSLGLDPRKPDSNDDGVLDAHTSVTVTLRDRAARLGNPINSGSSGDAGSTVSSTGDLSISSVRSSTAAWVDTDNEAADNNTFVDVSATITGAAASTADLQITALPAAAVPGIRSATAMISLSDTTESVAGTDGGTQTENFFLPSAVSDQLVDSQEPSTSSSSSLSLMSGGSPPTAQPSSSGISAALTLATPGLTGDEMARLRPIAWDEKQGEWKFVNNNVSISTAENTITIHSAELGLRYAVVDLDAWRATVTSCDPATTTGGAPIDLEIVLDQTLSVRRQDPTGERFRAAAAVVASLRPGDEAAIRSFTVTTADFGTGPSADGIPFEGPYDSVKANSLSHAQYVLTTLQNGPVYPAVNWYPYDDTAMYQAPGYSFGAQSFFWKPFRGEEPSDRERRAAWHRNGGDFFPEQDLNDPCRIHAVLFVTDGQLTPFSADGTVTADWTQSGNDGSADAGSSGEDDEWGVSSHGGASLLGQAVTTESTATVSTPCRPIHVLDVGADGGQDWLRELAQPCNGTYSYVPDGLDLTDWIRQVTPAPNLGTDYDTDTDGDGLTDWVERHGVQAGSVRGLFTSDPTKVDTDGDGLTDAEEIGKPFAEAELGTRQGPEPITTYHLISNPRRVDSDNDGLQDSEEFELHSPALAADTDRDGIKDGEEFQWGTRWHDADSDGDGRDDWFETRWVDEGWDATRWQEPVDKYQYVNDFALGFLCGDNSVCARGTLAWLAGNLASSYLVFGDVRDIVAAGLERDWANVALVGVGFVPYFGDTTETVGKVVRFIRRITTGTPVARAGVQLLAIRPTQVNNVKLQDVIKLIEKVAGEDAALAVIRQSFKELTPKLEAAGMKSDEIVKLISNNDPDHLLRMLRFSTPDAKPRVGYLDDRSGGTGEFILSNWFGGSTQKERFTTVAGQVRYPDVRVLQADRTLRLLESKIGAVNHNTANARQIAADEAIIGSGRAHPEWHFFASAHGYKIGPNPFLLQLLIDAHIPFYVHLP
ncbi:discoidin domain-containing protein [Kineococcus sp. LSe6-4]|uniref:Discoidin domain-containing protein n=1 Tax=Kineococcus halophytocola TaxID=3234027 RepID=A0ABV4H6P3_9ACTN